MQTLKSLNWSAITAALVALGIITTADPMLAAVSIAGMLIVTFGNFLARTFGIRIGAGWLSIGLYAVSTVIAIMLDPVSIPAFPAFGSDPAQFAQAVADFIAQTAPLAGVITTAATLVYNALKPLVFDKYLPIVDEIGKLEPENIG